MTTPTSPDAEREQQLNDVLLALVQALEKGQAPDQHQFLAAHPEFAAELAEFFAGRDRLERLAAPLRAAGRASRFPGSPSGFPVAFPAALSPVPPAHGLDTGRSDPPSPVAELGQLGDFRLLREVGRGGMGIVYEAEQISLNRRVALKVLPFAAALDPRQLQRFKNEAQAAALLHHQHIVPIYAVGYERGIHYYSMQFIEGQSLAALIQGLRQAPGERAPARPPAPPGTEANQPVPNNRTQAATPPPGEAAAAGNETVSPPAGISTERWRRWKVQYFRRVAELGATAAEALDHAHQLGVVHRDIKPANLLVDRRGNLWITDFGLALLQNNVGLTTTGELVGTLRYMSPEQAGARRGLVDHRTDVYSLGVTLYELLTLRPLFEGNDPRHLLHQIAEEEPRPPRSVDRAIPAELETIVLKALAKGPAERYGSAQELADDLRRFLGDQPVRARRPTLLDRATKWSRRHKTVVVSALVLLLLATAGLLVSTVLIAQAHDKATAAYQQERQRAEEAEQQRARAEANFLQARRAVDLLTQVSAQELVDKPEFLEVRRKLLAGALQYYQDFIDQHQGDLSTQTELEASRARVAQILSDLSAQQQYLQRMLLTMLLGEKDVQDDLRITFDQEDRIWDLSDRLQEQRHEALRMHSQLSEEERGKRFKEMAAANETAVAAILTPTQAQRLKQIALQQRGSQAFAEAEVAEALHLTPDQQTRIRALQDEAQRAAGRACRPGRPPDEEDRETQQIGKNTVDKVLAVLAPAQQAAWKELTGEPFQGRIHFSRDIGFGPPGPNHPEPPPGPGRGPGEGHPPPDDGHGPGGGPHGGRPPPGDGHGPGRPDRFW